MAVIGSLIPLIRDIELTNVDNFQIGDTKKQLNHGEPIDKNKNTINADNNHDEINQLIKRSNNQENEMIKHTQTSNGDTFESQMSLIYTNDIIHGIYGNIPTSPNNECYILDAGIHGSVILGINNIIDSASTPNLNNVIGFMTKNDTEVIDSDILLPVSDSVSHETYKNMLCFSHLNFNNSIGTYVKPRIQKTYAELNTNAGIGQSSPSSTVNAPNQLISSKHVVDFTAYTNYDILFFMYVIKTISNYDISTYANKKIFLNKLNFFLNKKDTNPAINDFICKNKLHIITIINLNFLWQSVMRYCKSLINTPTKPPADNEEKIFTILSNINFVEMIIEKKKNIKEAKYKTGYINYPEIKANYKPPRQAVSFDTILTMLETSDISDSNNITEIIEHISAYIYYFFNNRDTNLQTTSDTYCFYTSQPFCAKNIIKITSSDKVKNRNDSSTVHEVQEESMQDGIDNLILKFKNKPPPAQQAPNNLSSYEEAFLYRILKFQGDSSHIVFSQIINIAFNELVISEPYIHLGYSQEAFIHYYCIEPAQGIIDIKDNDAIKIQILTGERPMMFRAPLELISIKSVAFDVFSKNGITGDYVKYESNPCVMFEETKNIYKKILLTGNTLYDTIIDFNENTALLQSIQTTINTIFTSLITNFTNNPLKIIASNNPELIEFMTYSTDTNNVQSVVGNEYTAPVIAAPGQSKTILTYLNNIIINSDRCKNYNEKKLYTKLYGFNDVNIIELIKIKNFFDSIRELIILFKDIYIKLNTIGDIYDIYKEYFEIKNIYSSAIAFDDKSGYLNTIKKIKHFINKFNLIFDQDGELQNSSVKINDGDKNLIKQLYRIINEKIQECIGHFNNFSKVYIKLNSFEYYVFNDTIYKYESKKQNLDILCNRSYNKDYSSIRVDFVNNCIKQITPEMISKSDTNYENKKRLNMYTSYVNETGELLEILYKNSNNIKINNPDNITTIINNNKIYEYIYKYIEILNIFKNVGLLLSDMLIHKKVEYKKYYKAIELFKNGYKLLFKIVNRDIQDINPNQQLVSQNPQPKLLPVEVKSKSCGNKFDTINRSLIDLSNRCGLFDLNNLFFYQNVSGCLLVLFNSLLLYINETIIQSDASKRQPIDGIDINNIDTFDISSILPIIQHPDISIRIDKKIKMIICEDDGTLIKQKLLYFCGLFSNSYFNIIISNTQYKSLMTTYSDNSFKRFMYIPSIETPINDYIISILLSYLIQNNPYQILSLNNEIHTLRPIRPVIGGNIKLYKKPKIKSCKRGGAAAAQESDDLMGNYKGDRYPMSDPLIEEIYKLYEAIKPLTKIQDKIDIITKYKSKIYTSIRSRDICNIKLNEIMNHRYTYKLYDIFVTYNNRTDINKAVRLLYNFYNYYIDLFGTLRNVELPVEQQKAKGQKVKGAVEEECIYKKIKRTYPNALYMSDTIKRNLLSCIRGHKSFKDDDIILDNISDLLKILKKEYPRELVKELPHVGAEEIKDDGGSIEAVEHIEGDLEEGERGEQLLYARNIPDNERILLLDRLLEKLQKAKGDEGTVKIDLFILSNDDIFQSEVSQKTIEKLDSKQTEINDKIVQANEYAHIIYDYTIEILQYNIENFNFFIKSLKIIDFINHINTLYTHKLNQTNIKNILLYILNYEDYTKKYLIDKNIIKIWEDIMNYIDLSKTFNNYLINKQCLDALDLNKLVSQINEDRRINENGYTNLNVQEKYNSNPIYEKIYKNVTNFQNTIKNKTMLIEYSYIDFIYSIVIKSGNFNTNEEIKTDIEPIYEEPEFVSTYNNIMENCNDTTYEFFINCVSRDDAFIF